MLSFLYQKKEATRPHYQLAMFLIRSVLVSILVAVVLASAASARFPGATTRPLFTTKTAVATRKAGFVLAIPRGGAGPLDPEVAARAMACAGMAQGLLLNVAPEMASEMYGPIEKGKKVSKEDATQFMISQIGCGILSYGVALYALLLKEADLSVAIQATYILWFYHSLRMILSGDWDRACGVGASSGGWFSVAIFSWAIFAMTQGFADTANKVLSAFWILCGVQMIVAPESAWASWRGDPKKLTDRLKFTLSTFGYYLVAFSAVPLAMLMLDATPVQAAGYGSLVWAAYFLINILNGSYKKIGVAEGKHWIWFALHGIVSATTLL